MSNSDRSQKFWTVDDLRLKKRLWRRGFHCFLAARDVDLSLPDDKLELELDKAFHSDNRPIDLIYAVLEFQMYTRWSPCLGVIGVDKKLIPSDATIRANLDQVLARAASANEIEPNGVWSDLWEDCLGLWEVATSPPSEPGHRGYVCPVVIERLLGVAQEVDEGTDLDGYEADRANVWWIDEETDHQPKRQPNFSARDVSGWFSIDAAADPAYHPDPPDHKRPYDPPTDIASPAFLHRRRIALIGARYPAKKTYGPRVGNWRATEFRPKLLGNPDQARIRTDPRWGALYRIARAVARVESERYFDGFQAYDDAILSIPLFHYAIPGNGRPPKEQRPLPVQAGGIALWLNTDDTRYSHRPNLERHWLSALGLATFPSERWTDAADTDKPDFYDTGSGEDHSGPSSVVASLRPPASINDVKEYRDTLELLRRPHMVYRLAMHLRTLPESRRALWRHAVHLVRQLAWLRIAAAPGVPPGWHERPLSEVVTSERSLALILRIAVYSPGFVFTVSRGRRPTYAASYIDRSGARVDALVRWMCAASNAAEGNQSTFEAVLCELLTGKKPYVPVGAMVPTTIPELSQVDAATLMMVSNWPKSEGEMHLDETEVAGGITGLSAAAGSSPFSLIVDGKWRIDDPVPAWWRPDGGHPPASHAPPMFTRDGLRAGARAMAVTPALFAAPWIGDREELIDAQIAREVQTSAACGWALDEDDNLIKTHLDHDLPRHGTYNQRWSRLQLHGFVRKRWSTALKCGNDPALPPIPAEALWRIDANPHLVYAFDGRNGDEAEAAKGVAVGQFKSDDHGGGRVSSAQDQLAGDDRKTFDVPDDALARATFAMFVASRRRADDTVPAADHVEILFNRREVSATFGEAPIVFGFSNRAVAASRYGLMLEFLSWRARAEPASDPARAFILSSGLAMRTRSRPDEFFSFYSDELLDPWTQRLALKMPTRKGQRPALATPMQVAAGHLTWPAIHRWRALLRSSALARRMLWDAWRIRFREVLSRPAVGLGFDVPLRIHDLFQSPPELSAIGLWLETDAEDMRRVWGSKSFGKAMREWLKQDPALKVVENWQGADEALVFWEKLVPFAKPESLRKRLEKLRPANPPIRQFRTDLDEIVYSESLEGCQWPGTPKAPGARAGVVLVAPNGSAFGLALLTTSIEDGLAAPAAPRSEFWITGVAPLAQSIGSTRGAALMLPKPVEVRLSRKADPPQKVLLFGAANELATEVEWPAAEVEQNSHFLVEVDVTSWLGELGDEVAVTLLASAAVEGGKTTAKLGLRITLPWLRAPIERPLASVDSLPGVTFDLVSRTIRWKSAFGDLQSAFPFRASATGQVEVRVGIDASGEPFGTLEAGLDDLYLQLGGPIASLGLRSVSQGELVKITASLVHTAARAVVELPASIRPTLSLKLASLVKGDPSSARVLPTDVLQLNGLRRIGRLVSPDEVGAVFVLDLGEIPVPSGVTSIAFEGTGLRVPAWLFPSRVWKSVREDEHRMLDGAPRWFGGDVADVVTSLLEGVETSQLNHRLALTLRPTVRLRGTTGSRESLGEAELKLTAVCGIDAQGFLELMPHAFACLEASAKVSFKMQSRSVEVGQFFTVHLPGQLQAILNFHDSRKLLEFVSLEREPIGVEIPAKGGFRFDFTEFAIGSAGVTASARIRKGAVKLANAEAISETLIVREQSGGRGTLRIERGRMVSASLVADARLKFFDDAEGELALTLFEEDDGSGGVALGAQAELQLQLGKSFHVKALYLRFDVDTVRVALQYRSGSWHASGGMTGGVAFEPSGPLTERLEEYSDLFDGVSAHFEDLSFSGFGNAAIRVTMTPRTFTLAKIFTVRLVGFEILPVKGLWAVGLLGAIDFAIPLGSLDAKLTLGDIRLWQPSVDARIPKIRVSSIGAAIKLASGFEIEGRLQEFDDDKEFGFGGEAFLKSSAFPGTRVSVKLSRVYERIDVKKENPRPSFVVYADTDRSDHLAYGFFLRKLGIGVAANQGLIGFSDTVAREKPLAGRINAALMTGIPYPGALGSWVPVEPPDSYSLVGFAQVTFGLLDRKTDHAFVTSLVLSLDERLDIVAGVNGWFIASPDDVLTAEFIKRPAVRGALGFSPSEQMIYGRFMTLKDPKFGPSVSGNLVGDLLKQALNQSTLAVTFYSDPQGALLEIGYPRQARFETALGPARGTAEAGFRIGYYRGTQVIGLNLAIAARAETGLSADLGFANVELSAFVDFLLQAGFAGAVTNDGKFYLLADMAVILALGVRARLYKEIRVRSFLASFNITLFDVSAGVAITAAARLAAALVPAGLGFDGVVQVAFNVCGFHVSAALRIAASPGRIGEARNQIDRLVPPIDVLTGQKNRPGHVKSGGSAFGPPGAGMARAFAALDAEREEPGPPSEWTYHVRCVGGNTRVVLYPAMVSSTELAYPVCKEGSTITRTHIFEFVDGVKFRGFVGLRSKKPLGPTVTIDENLADIVVEMGLAQNEDGSKAQLTTRDLLSGLEAAQRSSIREIVDARTQHPVAGDFDDSMVLADPKRRSTRLRRRYSERIPGEPFKPLTYDDYVDWAQAAGKPLPAPPGLTDGELLAFLLRLAESNEASPEHDISPTVVNDAGKPEVAPLRFPSRLGLVLEFDGIALADEIRRNGIRALAKNIQMFGTRIDPVHWQSPVRADQFEFDSSVSHWFQSVGEAGLSWQLSRNRRGKVIGDGPLSHDGVRHIEIERTTDLGSLEPRVFTVTPTWTECEDPEKRDGLVYIRPSFQFLDSTLPVDRDLVLRYTVRAIGPDGEARMPNDDGTVTNVLASLEFPLVHYQPSRVQPAVVHALALVRLPAGNSDSVATFEVFVAVERRGWSGDIASRLEACARPVRPGRVGTYGSGNESDVSLEWRKELGETELRIPQPVMSRRQGSDTEDAFRIAVDASEWKRIGQAPPKVQDADSDPPEPPEIYRLLIRFDHSNEDGLWKRLGIFDTGAAEIYVRLGPSCSDGRRNLPTLTQRARMAISGEPPIPVRLRAAGKGLSRRLEVSAEPGLLEALFAQGREVAALERFPVTSPGRQREWLSASQFEVDRAIRPPGVNGQLRVAVFGTLPYALGTDQSHAFGPVTGYRVWGIDQLELNDGGNSASATMSLLRGFQVLPEAVFRARPLIVDVRKLPNGGSQDSSESTDWTADGRRTAVDRVSKYPYCSPPSIPAVNFEEISHMSGAVGAVHVSIRNFADQLQEAMAARGNCRVRTTVTELFHPGATETPVPDRGKQLLERCEEAHDAFGWRLLEGLGACVTLLVEKDDTRLPPEEWDVVSLDVAREVLIMGFRKLGRDSVLDGTGISQYGVRVLSRVMVQQLRNLAESPDFVQDFLQRRDRSTWTAFHMALDCLTPKQKDEAAPATWFGLVNALALRARLYVDLAEQGSRIDPSQPVTMYWFRHLAGLSVPHGGPIDAVASLQNGSGEVVPGDAVATLPSRAGAVEFVRWLDHGYARRFVVAVEVVRRYDFRLTRTPTYGEILKGVSLGRAVDVPRTLPLSAERTAISVDPLDGAISVYMQAHPAQRASLYREELRTRFEFLEQTVVLRRSVAPGLEQLARNVFAALAGAGLDWDALESTWSGRIYPPGSLGGAVLTAALSPQRVSVRRGDHQIRYPFLPSGYQWRAISETLAGVRSSLDGEPAGSSSWIEPMFEPNGYRKAGLAYGDEQEFAWTLQGTTLRVELPLPRAIDSLAPTVQGYWAAIDERWNPGISAEPGDLIPVLQIPDFAAQYIVIAEHLEVKTRVELLRLEFRAIGEPVQARLLVSPYSVVSADAVQLSEGSAGGGRWAGRIGLRCEVDLDDPALGWLMSSLMTEAQSWTMGVAIRRDGVTFNSVRVS